MFETTGKTLIMLGAVMILIGLLVWLVPRVPFLGNLPGDISYQWGDTHVYIPTTTCAVASVVLTIIVNVIMHLVGK